MTDHEVKTIYKTIKQQLAIAGIEPDPKQAPRQVVEATMAKGTSKSEGLPFHVYMTRAMASDVTDLRIVLLDLQKVSPEAFGEFLEMLRTASGEM